MKTYALSCPMCKRYLGTYDGIGSMPFICDCRKCNRRIVYDQYKDEIKIQKIPSRNTISGITFH